MPEPASQSLTFMGAPGSPYTRKMRAMLRYRRIPYRFLISGAEGRTDLPVAKVRLLPTFYLPNAEGRVEAVVDSTPLIRRFEREFEGRSVIPPDPVTGFIDYLLEDFGDEWLTKAMFHYRWAYEADIEKAGQILPRWRQVEGPEEQFQQAAKMVSERQISRLWVVGSNETTGPVIEASYRRILELFRDHLTERQFLMGNRPGASDFAFFGQLTQLAAFDPTPMAVTLEVAPRVYAWVDRVEDLSGLEPDDDDWIGRELSATLRGLLGEVGRVYAPFLIANARALASGADRVECEIDDRPWVQKPFPYQGKCLMWLRERYGALSAEDRSAVDGLLDGTGCEALVAGGASGP
ncbi:MAG: glutathione S-transferase family protein [Holophagales bacterium]|nr:glutathione S-transferase family protein [Holophagales bacterium]MYH24663.1 glutathione S-transferase family protein [Holophagales bacterium]